MKAQNDGNEPYFNLPLTFGMDNYPPGQKRQYNFGDTPFELQDHSDPFPLRSHLPVDNSSTPFASNLGHGYGGGEFSFPDYRSAGLPSDQATSIVDSGYHTYEPYDTSSIRDDNGGGDTQETADLFNDLHVGASQLDKIDCSGSRSTAKKSFHCTECDKPVKTQAELNKHIQRHSKPHRCSYLNCKKSQSGQGFSTSNDLIRHKRSVHREFIGPFFVCRHGNCASKVDKEWPRADNFRNHLTRVHRIRLSADADLTSYLAPVMTSSGHVENVGRLALSVHKKHGQASLACSNEDNTRLTRLDKAFEGLLDGTVNDAIEISTKSATGPTWLPHDFLQGASSDGHFVSHLDLGAEMNDTSPVLLSRTPSAEHLMPSRHSSVVGEGILGAQINTSSRLWSYPELMGNGLDEHQIKEFLRTVPKHILQGVLEEDCSLSEKGADSRVPQTVLRGHQCKQCEKSFKRPSDLRKHMRRHERLYGCTFKDCEKRFGSKNDWKRHEKSQHTPMEAWYCSHECCKRMFLLRDSFKDHSQQHHSWMDGVALDEYVNTCRFGSHSDQGFWCGFCEDVVAVTSSQSDDPWTLRCDHIDAHLFGKDELAHRCMDDWCFLESREDIELLPTTPDIKVLPEGPKIPNERSNARKRKSKNKNQSHMRPNKKAAVGELGPWAKPRDSTNGFPAATLTRVA